MEVTVEVLGEDTRQLSMQEKEPTYLDILDHLNLSKHEVSVLVDGTPVPENQPIETDRVTIIRMIKGG